MPSSTRSAQKRSCDGETQVPHKKKSTGATTDDTAITLATNDDIELVDQVITILKAFFARSLFWTGGDGSLNFEESDLSLVHGKSFDDEFEELLVIVRKDEQPFTETFLTTLRPKLVVAVNEIVKANNDWLVATNFHAAHLTQAQVDQFLQVFLDPEITDEFINLEDGEEGLRKGAIGFRRSSGNDLDCCWDYTEPCDYGDQYKDLPKGKGKKVNPVK
jgi:hypothetical protein